MGLLGIETANVLNWEDIAKKDPLKPEDDVYWTALTDTLSAKEFDNILQKIEDGDPLISNGVVDDGILLTGQPTGLAREGIQASQLSDSEDEKG